MAEDSTSHSAVVEPRKQQTQIDSLQSWLSCHGNSGYETYKKETQTPILSYEEWASSDKVLGPYLYDLTLAALGDDDEDESSDDEETQEQAGTEVAEPKATSTLLTIKMNGHKKSEAVEESVVEAATGGELTESAPDVSPQNYPQEPPQKTPRGRGRPKKAHKPPNKSSSGSTKKKIDTSQKFLKELGLSTDAISPEASPVAATTPEESDAPRRGLRVRTAAQKRPYSNYADMFEEEEIVPGATGTRTTPLKPTPTSKLAEVSNATSDADVANNDISNMDVDLPNAVLSEEPASPVRMGKKKFKGKGRAWQKNEEDLDFDYHFGRNYKKRPSAIRKSRIAARASRGEAAVQDSGADQDASSPQETLISSMSLLGQEAWTVQQSLRAQGTPTALEAQSPQEFEDVEMAHTAEEAHDPHIHDAGEQTDGSLLVWPGEHPSGRKRRRPRKPYKSDKTIVSSSDQERGDTRQPVKDRSTKSIKKQPGKDEKKQTMKQPAKDDKKQAVQAEEASSSKRKRKRYISSEFVQDSGSEMEMEMGEQLGEQMAGEEATAADQHPWVPGVWEPHLKGPDGWAPIILTEGVNFRSGDPGQEAVTSGEGVARGGDNAEETNDAGEEIGAKENGIKDIRARYNRASGPDKITYETTKAYLAAREKMKGIDVNAERKEKGKAKAGPGEKKGRAEATLENEEKEARERDKVEAVVTAERGNGKAEQEKQGTSDAIDD